VNANATAIDPMIKNWLIRREQFTTPTSGNTEA